MEYEVKKFGEIKVGAGHGKKLKPHQEKAIREMNAAYAKSDPHAFFAGLLVFPTGAGKTITAVKWVLKNFMDNGFKILWIAHRHQLLTQAFEAFEGESQKENLPNRRSYKYRIISGDHTQHDRPVNIEPGDDLIISSKDSLQSDGLTYLLKNWKAGNQKMVLVVDEAHHAAAKTYRHIIDKLKEIVPDLKILGLTATPFRTSEKEKGILREIFPDDILAKEDLKTLIARDILAHPNFYDVSTGAEIVLSDREAVEIQHSIDLPEEVKKSLKAQSGRNRKIVEEYFHPTNQKSEPYEQAIVFAIDIEHAIALEALFNEHGKDAGVKAAYVVSNIRDMGTNVAISKGETADRIKRFKDGTINVLINVNILTEGFDAPQAKSVFLTRPTMSTILMTQMVGRVLRGSEMGGKSEAFVVSFIDDWQNKITWVSPEKLYLGESVLPESRESAPQFVRLISISKIQQFARMLDHSINTDDIEILPAIERIPLGSYSFQLEDGKVCDVLVYNNNEDAFSKMMEDLESLFVKADTDGNKELSDQEIESILNHVSENYFKYYDSFMYRDEDIRDILRYYAQMGIPPQFYPFKDRKKCDVTPLVDHVLKHALGPVAKNEFLKSEWYKEDSYYRLYFGHNFRFFQNEYQLEENKAVDPTTYLFKNELPSVIPGKLDITKMTIQEIKKYSYADYRRIVDEVYSRHRDKAGNLVCAASGYKSKLHRLFQIDHIKPMSKGGLTVSENLRLITRWENAKKGNQ